MWYIFKNRSKSTQVYLQQKSKQSPKSRLCCSSHMLLLESKTHPVKWKLVVVARIFILLWLFFQPIFFMALSVLPTHISWSRNFPRSLCSKILKASSSPRFLNLRRPWQKVVGNTESGSLPFSISRQKRMAEMQPLLMVGQTELSKLNMPETFPFWCLVQCPKSK